MFPDYIEYLMDGSQHIEKLSAGEGNVFRGLLIKPGKWKGYYYPAEELKKAIPTLINKMITLDHDDRFDSHIGIITNAYWDDNLNGVVIDFKVIDPKILEKLNHMAEEGLLSQVGLSAELSYTTITNDDNRAVKGISFKKATLTFYPAVRDARLIAKLSQDLYEIEIIESHDDGTIIAKLIPKIDNSLDGMEIENAKKKDDYPYPTPDSEAGKPYPAPTGYPIPPDEWKQVKEAIADLQKRIAELEKKLLKNSEVELSENTDNTTTESKPQEVAPAPAPAQVQPQPAQTVPPDPNSTVQQGPYPQTQPQTVAQQPVPQPQTTQPTQPVQPVQPTQPQPQQPQSAPPAVVQAVQTTAATIAPTPANTPTPQPQVQPAQVQSQPASTQPIQPQPQSQPQPQVTEATTQTTTQPNKEPLTIGSTPEPSSTPELPSANTNTEPEEDPLLKALQESERWSALPEEAKRKVLEQLGIFENLL